jgi:pSer/pThr/pTyr-binding forkhead associated (FHA) protein
MALGSDFDQMPSELDGMRVSRIVLSDYRVSPYHALIRERNGELIIVDQNSSTGIEINGVRLPSSTLLDRDRIRIGSFEIHVRANTNQVQTNTTVGTGNTGVCERMVGFLFKRRCGRTDPRGCSYCQDGRVYEDPYATEYSYYQGYGRYDDWGSDYYYRRDRYHYNRETGDVDFTEADSEAFENETDMDFEQDFGAS